jgi:hypothetical protein
MKKRAARNYYLGRSKFNNILRLSKYSNFYFMFRACIHFALGSPAGAAKSVNFKHALKALKQKIFS